MPDVFYPTYTRVPRLFDLSALNDQITAVVGMWVIGDIVFLGPVMLISFSLLSTHRRRPQN
jgi:hypothetical protein